ncbi:Pycsar system effector family protein [Streptomyces sp. NPDC051051]|uniref:Pycsar system effector family protein n=1 Tax=Streptomyces sp. NPDC051051 TaxID=3155666 RepID=UPI003415E946
MTTPTTSTTMDKNLDAACAAVAGEITRTDSKASLLLAFNGAVLAGLASLADKKLPLPAQVAGGAAALALTASAVLLLLVVRPRLGGDDRASFPYWARLDETEIHACMDGDTRAARIRVLSTIAVAKFTRLRRAVDCTLTALAFLAAAGTALL